MSGPAPDPDQARAAMVANQLRARGVTNERVLAAMGAIPRAVRPEDQRRSAYRDEALPIEPARRSANRYGRQDDRAPRRRAR
jgi:protein-L-isoaspartate O-methyltransferase